MKTYSSNQRIPFSYGYISWNVRYFKGSLNDSLVTSHYAELFSLQEINFK